jgi:hypothetical protein
VDNISVTLEHVDLLNGLDGLHIELLQRSLELLVVGTSALVDLLDLPAGSTLASVSPVSLASLTSISLVVYFSLSFADYCGGSRVRDNIRCGAVETEERLAYPIRTLLAIVYPDKIATTKDSMQQGS